MQPADLQADQFSGYSPLGRQLAIQNLALLRQLPLVLLPLLLGEVRSYDWNFPLERREVDIQFRYLHSLPQAQLRSAMELFSGITLPAIASQVDWVNHPRLFSEYLSAGLWATGQIEKFRAASTQYVNAYHAAYPPEPPPVSRLAMVIVGQGVSEASFPLFRKLRPHGVHYTNVTKTDASKALHDTLARRAAAHPMAYGHWYVDGGEASGSSPSNVTGISYANLSPLRIAVVEKMRTMGRASSGPEGLQKMLQALAPAAFPGLSSAPDQVLAHFQLSIFTEGSGTQFYSTTFADWTAHELLRRAQPLTTLVRFAPRQVQRPIDEMILDQQGKAAVDPEGSLLDADMAAYYIWIDQGKLPQGHDAGFLVWFEDHQEAVMIAPNLPRGAEETKPTSFADLLKPFA